MSFLVAFISLVPIFLVGDFIYVKLFAEPSEKISFSFRWSLALAVGTGVLTLILFYTSLVNFRYGYTVTISIALLFSVLYVALGMRRWTGRKRFGINLRRTALFILIGLLLIAILWYISQLAGLGVDGYAHWGIKAKASFLDGGWILSREGMRRFSHPVYPLLVPSQQGWIYTFLGQVDEQAVKIVFVMFYLALGALFYHAVRPFFNKILTVFFTLLMMSTPLLALSALAAYADIPLMFFLFGSVFFLIKWLDQGRIRDMVIGAVLAAFLLLVKREGTIYWLVLLIFPFGQYLFSRRKGQRSVPAGHTLVFPIVAILIAGSWFMLLRFTSIEYGSFEAPSLALLVARRGRLVVIAEMLVRELFLNFRAWGILWSLFLAITVWKRRSFTQPAPLLLWISVVLPIILLSGSFVFSVWPSYTLHIETALSRLILHTVPLAWLFIAMQSADLKAWFNELRYGTMPESAPVAE